MKESPHWMSPSAAHDTAWKRDAGHDQMQLDIMRYLEDNAELVAGPRRPDRRYFYRAVRAEHLFRMGSGRVFFADLSVEWCYDAPPQTFLMLLEVKPKIYSAGAVIRQCAVLQMHARHYARERISDKMHVMVAAVVRKEDPLRHVLASLSTQPVLTWDGEYLRKADVLPDGPASDEDEL